MREDDIPHCAHHAGRTILGPGLYGCGACDWQKEGPVWEEDE